MESRDFYIEKQEKHYNTEKLFLLAMKRMRGKLTKTRNQRQVLARLKICTYYKASICLLISTSHNSNPNSFQKFYRLFFWDELWTEVILILDTLWRENEQS